MQKNIGEQVSSELDKIIAKKEATDLVNKFYFKLPNNGSLFIGLNNCNQRVKEARECALISIDRTIDILKEIRYKEHSDNFWYIEDAILKQCLIKIELEKL